MNTSASLQLVCSCTPRQSLLNVVVVEGLSGTFKRLQRARARAGCACPLKTTMFLMRGGHHISRPAGLARAFFGKALVFLLELLVCQLSVDNENAMPERN